MLVNMQAFEDARRVGQVTEYEVYPRQSSDIDKYQVKAENVPSVISEDVRMLHGGALIDFWEEEKGIVWSKLPKLLAKTPQRLFALVGGIPSSASNGDNIFSLFDEFLGDTLDTEKWTAYKRNSDAAIVEVVDGTLHLAGEAGVTSSGNVKSILTFTNAVAIEIKRKCDSENYRHFSLGSGAVCEREVTKYYETTLKDSYCWYIGGAGADQAQLQEVDSDCDKINLDVATIAAATDYERVLFTYDSNGVLKWLVNTIEEISTTDTTYLADSKNILITQGEYKDGRGGNQYVDWVFVRKYASPEPLILKKAILGKAAMIRAVIAS